MMKLALTRRKLPNVSRWFAAILPCSCIAVGAAISGGLVLPLPYPDLVQTVEISYQISTGGDDLPLEHVNIDNSSLAASGYGGAPIDETIGRPVHSWIVDEDGRRFLKVEIRDWPD